MGDGYEVKNTNVMQINKMNITGNVVPISWFKHLRFEKSNKPHLPAIMILSDIIYWYRPMKKRDEETGMVVEYKQKFKADMLQKQYKLWMELYGFGKSQTKNAVDFLVDKGLINREFRNVELHNGEILYNRMFVEPVPQAIAKITYPSDKPNGSSKQPSSFQNGEGVVSKSGGGNLEKMGSSSENDDLHGLKQGDGRTDVNNTDTTTDTTTETTTESTTSNNNINKKGEFEKLSTTKDKSKIYEIFNASFGKLPNQIQLNKLQSYEFENKLLYNIIKQMGLGGHNPTFMFNKLDDLENKNIKTFKDFKANKDKSDNGIFENWNDGFFEVDSDKDTDEKVIESDIEKQVDPNTYKPKKLDYVNEKTNYKTLKTKEIWNEVCLYLKKNLNTISFNTWFRPIEPLDLKDDTLKIQTPNFFIQDWIEKNYYALISDILYSLTCQEMKINITTNS